jgi:hypothetical protein
MSGILARRLTRELGKVKPGDEVTLRLWADGRYRDVKVKTVAREDLPGERRTPRSEMEDRAVIGVSLEGTGSRRDTLGLLVTRVAEGGPAEKAGIVEGDRVAAINGVSLRVPSEDAGDEWISSAKAGRFSREVRKLKVGDELELRVWSGGQFKTVRVRTGRAADVYKNERDGFRFFLGDRFSEIAPMPPMPPMPPMTPMPAVAPRVFSLPHIQFDPGVEVDIDAAGEAAREATREAMERAREALERARMEIEMRRGVEGELRIRAPRPGVRVTTEVMSARPRAMVAPAYAAAAVPGWW